MCAAVFLFTGLYVVTSIGRAAGDCRLPAHPAHGRHQPFGGDCGGGGQHPACDGAPGTLAPEEWLLKVSCDPGYQPSDPSSADVAAVCSGGAWSTPQLPPCVLPDFSNDREQCTVPSPPPNSQYRVLPEECGGENLPPGSAVPHDCIVFISCNPGYRRRHGSGDLITSCANKTWNPTIPNDLCIKAVDTNTIAPVRPTSLPTETPPILPSSKGCLLPNVMGDATRFCSLAGDCEQDCDFYNRRCHLLPGSRRASQVKVVCKAGYTLQTSEVSVCLSKGWFPSITQCIKLCRPLKSDGLLLYCHYNNAIDSCSKHSLPGTWVEFKCKPGYSEFPDLKRQGEYTKTIRCKDGEWSTDLPLCKAECGVSKAVQTFSPLVVDGQQAHVGLFPWHAGLYSRKEEDGRVIWDQICGGTLISDRVVLTAAHCVAEVANKNDIRVALGKYYRSWDRQEPTEEKRNVSDIVYPRQYNNKGFPFDIALVLLSQKITFGQYIMPACRDHDERTAHLQKASRELHVVGWGKVGSALNAPSSETLLHNTITALSEDECNKFAPFFLLDKFCAYKSNAESTVQRGDSGGGVTAVYEDGLHYVVGIVSIRLNDTAFFTNITWKTHFDWLEYELSEFKNYS